MHSTQPCCILSMAGHTLSPQVLCATTASLGPQYPHHLFYSLSNDQQCDIVLFIDPWHGRIVAEALEQHP